MSVPPVSLSELTAHLMREVFQALTSSADEQNAAFVELAAQVGVPLESYLETHLGAGTAEQARSADAYLREAVFPLLSIPSGYPLTGLIPLTEDGRNRLIDHFRGVAAASGSIDTQIRPAPAKGRWTVPADVLVQFSLAWLRRDAEHSYRRARALLAAGVQKVTVTSGQVVTKMIFQVATPPSLPPAAPLPGPAQGRVRFLAAETVSTRSPAPGRRLQPLDVRVQVANENTAQSAAAVGTLQIDFRADSFPPVPASDS